MWLLADEVTNCDWNILGGKEKKQTKCKVLKCLFKKGDEYAFTSLRSALAHPRGVSMVHTTLLNCWTQLTPHGIHQIPTEHLPTLYLSIGSSCCSWLSRIVWYSLSYFFSFFVGTCGIELGNMDLKIRECWKSCLKALPTNWGSAGKLLLKILSPLSPLPYSLSHVKHSPIQLTSTEIFHCC